MDTARRTRGRRSSELAERAPTADAWLVAWTTATRTRRALHTVHDALHDDASRSRAGADHDARVPLDQPDTETATRRPRAEAVRAVVPSARPGELGAVARAPVRVRPRSSRH